MPETNHRNTSCRICKCDRLHNVMKLKPTPLADAYIPLELNTRQHLFPLDLFYCNNCGLVQLLDVIHPEEIYVNYIYKTESSFGLQKHFDYYAREVVNKFSVEPNSMILDLGSNDGSLLLAFKNIGMRVLGVDPAVEIAKFAEEHNGVHTLPSFFTFKLSKMIVEQYGKSKIITCNNLLANVDDLDEFVKGIKYVLDNDGLFICESFYLPSMIQNMVFDFTYHEHISYFYLKPLEYLFSCHGMQLIDAQPISTKGGSMRYAFGHNNSDYKPFSTCKTARDIESSLMSDTVKVFKDFETRVNQAKLALLSVIKDLKSQGKNIVGFGASATSTTLLYHFSLQKYIDYFIDENPAKIGLQSPGAHIKVYDVSKIYDSKPDIILIFAWRFEKTIISNNLPYLQNGGEFIIPLPTLKRITIKNSNEYS